jgi:TetR/AcrR family transcriptional repressor of nem operon
MRKNTDTKIKLLETAVRLVWQSNYDSVGVAEICRQAGVTKGSFYHYFDTKADLFYAASKHHWAEFKQEFDAALSPSFTPLEQLENFFGMIFSHQEESLEMTGETVAGCPFFTSGGQVGVEEDKVRLAALEMTENALKYDTALVRSLKGGGYLEEDVDPEQTGRLISNYIHGTFTYARIHNSFEPIYRDIRVGIYRMLTLKKEYWVEGSEKVKLQAEAEPATV